MQPSNVTPILHQRVCWVYVLWRAKGIGIQHERIKRNHQNRSVCLSTNPSDRKVLVHRLHGFLSYPELALLRLRYRPFQSTVVLAKSSPTVFGDRTKGPFLRVKADVVPSLLPIHFRYTTLMLWRSNFYSTVEVAGDRWTQIWDNQKSFTIVPRNPKTASSFSRGQTQDIRLAQPAPLLAEPSPYRE